MSKILVIDDSATIRESLVYVLTNAGHTVEQATNGKEGLGKFKEDRDYSLVIVDWNMPEMNGIDFLVNARKISRDIPIILLTTETEKEKINMARSYKANAWLLKPFVEEDLLRIVKLLTKNNLK